MHDKFKFNMPNKKDSVDPLARSKFHHLLDHDGVPYNLELKKDILRAMEERKKFAINSDKVKAPTQNSLRNFK